MCRACTFLPTHRVLQFQSTLGQYSGIYHLSGSSCFISLGWKEAYMQGPAGRELDHLLSCEQKIGASAITEDSGTSHNARMSGTEHRVIFKCTVQEYSSPKSTTKPWMLKKSKFFIKSDLPLDVSWTDNNLNNMVEKSSISLLLYLKISSIDMG